MGMQQFYKEAMDLNTMEDLESRREAARAFFVKLNHMEMPAHSNWAEQILEGLHVRQRPDHPVLIWADMETGQERRFSYSQLAAEGNRCLNFLRRNRVDQDCNMYMMIPIVP